MKKPFTRRQQFGLAARRKVVVLSTVLMWIGPAHGIGNALQIPTVAVGHPGNPPELSGVGAGGDGPNRLCGFVDYPYRIGTFEVTASEYVQFLNAVAATDTYGLYNPAMWTDAAGCRIQRTGSPGGFVYSVAEDWAERPVNLVSWGDAARFCNWLHNGQPSGMQNLSTTEDGSYFLNGASGNAALMNVVRKPGATWVIPTEDEWYKAAFHENDGPTPHYFQFPTRSNATPGNQPGSPDPGNTCNYYAGGFTLGPPYFRAPVGTFFNSPGPYGTYDQGGNVWEWNETVVPSLGRGLRGGSYSSEADRLRSATRGYALPTQESVGFGFRVVNLQTVEEIPAVSLGGIHLAVLFAIAGAILVKRRINHRSGSGSIAC